MRRLISSASTLLLVAFVAAGCRPDARPSAEYEKASKLWLAAVTERAEDAAEDPRANEALSLARAVSPESIDSQAAQALVARIEQARKEAQERRDRPEPSPAPLVSDTTPAIAAADPFAEPPVEPVPPPAVGSPEADFRERYGDCVRVDSPFIEARGTRQGEAWVLTDDETCRETHPELADKLVFVLGGKIFNVAPRAAVVQVVQTDAGWLPESGNWPEPPDAGTDE